MATAHKARGVCAQIAYRAVDGGAMLTQRIALLSCFTSEGVDRKAAG